VRHHHDFNISVAHAPKGLDRRQSRTGDPTRSSRGILTALSISFGLWSAIIAVIMAWR